MTDGGTTPTRAAETWFARILTHWPASRRRRIATAIALVAILVATIIASSRILRLLYQELDVLAYAGLFAACWVGAGGALVPIPGVRPISWFMIVQQGAALDPVVVALVAATAMALGQTSYFLAARAARRHALGDAVAVPDASPDPDPTALATAGTDPAEDPAAVPHSGPMADLAEPAPGRRAQRMEAARRRVTRQVQTHGAATVFAVCALPTPLTTLTTTAAAAAGMGYVRYLPAAFGGYLVLSFVLVLFGQGLGTLLHSLVPFP